MALSQSAASELLEAFRSGEGVDLIRESVRLVLQELIETEAAEVIGAVLADTHDEWQVHERRYFSEASMALLDPTRDTEPAAIHSGT